MKSRPRRLCGLGGFARGEAQRYGREGATRVVLASPVTAGNKLLLLLQSGGREGGMSHGVRETERGATLFSCASLFNFYKRDLPY